ncbi:type III-B CRISPR module-associated protein Cmr3 [Candidatus Synechococcus calcipolaris G9]|uniref:Type III-B CRISPR module-associated protein Cmr3 n=1 Tax=Candidatus Synechococcus calcipolaris G9 TaxID=1497997 RepID=A0ABT6EZQ9_9SYNE|nr:type III-B CRISPR module-associated Cmr3 family protein [Candidatus Synechococcus calcipolaris]MDG2991065.1 type III-B CRISPR module-associated protein Cmr3 [Candidatus Synechococcus calcipolaris G9]
MTHLDGLHWYRLEPLDILLFRDARPFNPGDGSWAKSLCPPPPQTVFQALRSTLPAYQTKNRDLTFIGPFLMDETDTVWVTTPKDLICIGPDPGKASDKKTGVNDVLDHDQLSRVKRLDRMVPAQGDRWQWIHHPLPGSLRPIVPPQLNPKEKEVIMGRPGPLMKLSALESYLKGDLSKLRAQTDFHILPWDTQILPHNSLAQGSRQVLPEGGYFTEVATRLKPGWAFLAGISCQITSSTTRLGGEGHHVQISPLTDQPLESLRQSLQRDLAPTGGTVAYVLTPGLAQAESNAPIYGLYPQDWLSDSIGLIGVVGDRPLLMGGISVINRKGGEREPAYLPQRAFVSPGTIYCFEKAYQPDVNRLLSGVNAVTKKTLEALHYGQLLWGR